MGGGGEGASQGVQLFLDIAIREGKPLLSHLRVERIALHQTMCQGSLFFVILWNLSENGYGKKCAIRWGGVSEDQRDKPVPTKNVF